jgi:hypothetical protein
MLLLSIIPYPALNVKPLYSISIDLIVLLINSIIDLLGDLMAGVNVCFSGVYDTTSYIRPENQGGTGVNLLSLRDNDGVVVTAPTTNTDEAALGGSFTAYSRAVGVGGTVDIATKIAISARNSRSRDTLIIENVSGGGQSVYVSSSSLVDATGTNRGLEIPVGTSKQWPIGNNGVTVYVVTAANTATVVWSAP